MTFLALVVLPTAVIGWISVTVYRTILYPEYIRQAESAADQLVLALDSRIRSYELLFSRISADLELQDCLLRTYDDQEDRWNTIRYLTRVYEPVSGYLPGILHLRFYTDNQSLSEDGGILWIPSARPMGSETERQWFDRSMDAASPTVWEYRPDLISKGQNFLLSRQIVTVSGLKVGLILAIIDRSAIFGDFTRDAHLKNLSLTISDSSGVVLASSDKALEGTKSGIPRDSGYSAIRRDLYPGWQLNETIPHMVLDAKTRAMIVWVVIFSSVLVILDGLWLLLIIRNIRRRLREIGKHMSAVSFGDFVILDQSGHKDELSEIETSFNRMSERLQNLMNEIMEVRIREREGSFKALQAQVNPHFLYNSLSVLRWMALDGNTADLCTAIDALAQFYRISLKTTAGFIPISGEIEHVKAYVEIQQIRFRHAVAVEFDVESGVENLYTIKLMLQPLVENCYKHGRVTKSGTGRIAISVRRIDDRVLFTVSDNGVGIELETLEALQAGIAEPSREGGYGLSNVLEQLKVCFADRASIAFESVPGEGTSITVSIPVCETVPELRN